MLINYTTIINTLNEAKDIDNKEKYKILNSVCNDNFLIVTFIDIMLENFSNIQNEKYQPTEFIENYEKYVLAKLYVKNKSHENANFFFDIHYVNIVIAYNYIINYIKNDLNIN